MLYKTYRIDEVIHFTFCHVSFEISSSRGGRKALFRGLISNWKPLGNGRPQHSYRSVVDLKKHTTPLIGYRTHTGVAGFLKTAKSLAKALDGS